MQFYQIENFRIKVPDNQAIAYFDRLKKSHHITRAALLMQCLNLLSNEKIVDQFGDWLLRQRFEDPAVKYRLIDAISKRIYHLVLTKYPPRTSIALTHSVLHKSPSVEHRLLPFQSVHLLLRSHPLHRKWDDRFHEALQTYMRSPNDLIPSLRARWR